MRESGGRQLARGDDSADIPVLLGHGEACSDLVGNVGSPPTSCTPVWGGGEGLMLCTLPGTEGVIRLSITMTDVCASNTWLISRG